MVAQGSDNCDFAQASRNKIWYIISGVQRATRGGVGFTCASCIMNPVQQYVFMIPGFSAQPCVPNKVPAYTCTLQTHGRSILQHQREGKRSFSCAWRQVYLHVCCVPPPVRFCRENLRNLVHKHLMPHLRGGLRGNGQLIYYKKQKHTKYIYIYVSTRAQP